MRSWDAARIAQESGARLARGRGTSTGPARVVVDSRLAGPGDLFVGLQGERVDGGTMAGEALAAGAWGALVAPSHESTITGGGVVLAHPDPLRALQQLASAWRDRLADGGTRIVAVTGSTGKTSTKDILAALLAAQARVFASAGNLNTEIGLPLAILKTPEDTEVLVLEMAMRGAGQIAELTAIARPEVGVIVSIGPVHLELLGSLEAIAAAKAELIAGLAAGATAVVPEGAELLAPHLRAELCTITFGPGGDVALAEQQGGELHIRLAGAAAREGAETVTLQPSFSQAHNVSNLLAAVAAARALGYTPEGEVHVAFSALRGERLELPGGVVLLNDCYNANPMSMEAALDDLAQVASGRRVAVLGDMLELGPRAVEFHRAVGAHAAARGVGLLVAVGTLAAHIAEEFSGEAHIVPDARSAAELLSGLLRTGDTVLVKGSRGIGLEQVADALGASAEASGAPAARELAAGGGAR